MLEFPLLYIKGMRIVTFQLSGFYHEHLSPAKSKPTFQRQLLRLYQDLDAMTVPDVDGAVPDFRRILGGILLVFYSYTPKP